MKDDAEGYRRKISENARELEKRSRKIVEIEHALELKAQRIAIIESELELRKRKIVDLGLALREKNAILEEIYSSKGWLWADEVSELEIQARVCFPTVEKSVRGKNEGYCLPKPGTESESAQTWYGAGWTRLSYC